MILHSVHLRAAPVGRGKMRMNAAETIGDFIVFFEYIVLCSASDSIIVQHIGNQVKVLYISSVGDTVSFVSFVSVWSEIRPIIQDERTYCGECVQSAFD